MNGLIQGKINARTLAVILDDRQDSKKIALATYERKNDDDARDKD